MSKKEEFDLAGNMVKYSHDKNLLYINNTAGEIVYLYPTIKGFNLVKEEA